MANLPWKEPPPPFFTGKLAEHTTDNITVEHGHCFTPICSSATLIAEIFADVVNMSKLRRLACFILGAGIAYSAAVFVQYDSLVHLCRPVKAFI